MNDRGTLINLNGKIIPIAEAKVSVFDRSFLYGDSLYEVVRTYQGKPFRLKEHLARMEKSAALCQMKLSQTTKEYEREILRSIEAFRAQKGHELSDVYARIVVSRGAGKIGFGLGNLETPTLYVIIIEPISMFPNPDFKKGAKLQISKRVRNHPKALDPAMKSGNYLNSLLAYLTAAEAGYDDALMLDLQGFMTEGTTYNLFYVNRGIVGTSPLDIGILDGVTRRAILNLCVENSIPCREVRFPKEYLYEADEVFVSSSLKEVMPVLNLDGKKIGTGKPGPIATKLKSAFDELVKNELSLPESDGELKSSHLQSSAL
jgi:branched-chain amino acid aminotransferase